MKSLESESDLFVLDGDQGSIEMPLSPQNSAWASKLGDSNPQALKNLVESISMGTLLVASTTAYDIPRMCENLDHQQQPENKPHASASDAEYFSEPTDGSDSDLASDVQETSSELDFD